MRAVDIIIKKRDGGQLTAQEIDFFVRGFTNGEIPDYQASAFAMAVLLNGMTNFETTDLTLSMARSGQVLDLSRIVDIAVDKHSSGGDLLAHNGRGDQRHGRNRPGHIAQGVHLPVRRGKVERLTGEDDSLFFQLG